ncbi:MAG TPA: COX15/CtaA family protein [Terriglobales bacterium]|nr:COX15/CtaA family protein [Terriglobales bacterium]
MKSDPTPYNPAFHRFAVLTACATFILIIAGALVTSNDAGLSVPDWPTSYGHVLRLPPWIGGIRYEHSHRLIAGFTILLTIAIALWTWFADRRRWMKVLAFGALGTIIVQALLGGLTVLHFLPPAISTAHAAVAQTFFCIAVAIAVFTGRKWVEEAPAELEDSGRPSVLTLSLLSIFILYVQLVLGAMFRHHGMPWWPHVVNAVIVALVLTWTAVRALVQFPRIAAIRRPAVMSLFLLVLQLCLGFAAFLTRVVWGADAPQPEFSMVLATVSHVAVGALLLATIAILTLQTWRHSAARQKEEVPEGRAITA